MHQKQSPQSNVKHLKKMKKGTSSAHRVSQISRQTKRRFHCKVKFFMWRKRRQKFRFGMFHLNKKNIESPCLSLRIRLQKSKTRTGVKHTVNDRNIQVQTSASVLHVGCDTEGAGDTLTTRLPALNESDCLSRVANGSCCSQDCVTEPNAAPTLVSQTTQTTAEFSQNGDADITKPLKRCRSVGSPQNACRNACGELTALSNPGLAQRINVDRQSERQTAAAQSQTAEQEAEGAGEKTAASQTDDVSLKTLVKDIHEFLNDFYKKYGSFIPLQKSDVLQHLRSRFNTEFDDRQTQIFSEVLRWRAVIVLKPAPSFRVVYKKHVLTLEDLLTLADQNWLNDQVMNMYGELIMESSHHKVHFLNSFFHRQLMTKGYDGVKRWTKKVDLFSKSLLLVPIHLEVHWCLVTADINRKKICLYDSQGNALHKVARNILRYLITEAKEKKQAAFENGWTVSFDEKVPQQTTENDCGVFVLEYSRCLGLTKPLQFSQSDIPKIRKRIYRELCERKLFE